MNRISALPLVLTSGLMVAALGAAPAFAATAAPTTNLALRAAKTAVAPHQKDALTGTLKEGNTLLAGQAVTVEQRLAGAQSFKRAATKKTNSKGQVVFTATPGTKKGQKEEYRLVYPGNNSHRASHSAIVTVTVS